MPDVIDSGLDQARLLLTARASPVAVEEVVDEDAPVGRGGRPEPQRGRGRPPRGSGVRTCSCQGPRRPASARREWGAPSRRPPTSSASPASSVTRRPSRRDHGGRAGDRTRDPVAETVRPRGAAITVVVSGGPAESTVPSVVGLTGQRHQHAQRRWVQRRGGGARTPATPPQDSTRHRPGPGGSTTAPTDPPTSRSTSASSWNPVDSGVIQTVRRPG